MSTCAGSLMGTKLSLRKGQGSVLWRSHETERSRKGKGFGFGENSMNDTHPKAVSRERG